MSSLEPELSGEERALIAFFDDVAQPTFTDPKFRNGELTEKEGGEKVGELDIAVQEAFLKMTKRRFPSHAIVSEEQAYVWPPKTPNCLVFDPLDGTHNEAVGLGTFGCMLTAISNRKLAATVILVPWQEEVCGDGLYLAIRGQGAWQRVRGIWKKLRVSKVDRLDQSFAFFEGPPQFTGASNEFRRLWDAVRRKRNNMSCAISFTRLAGSNNQKLSAELCLAMVNTKPVYNIHGILMTEEAGGKVTGVYGQPWSFANFANLIFSNGLVHEAALRCLSGNMPI